MEVFIDGQKIGDTQEIKFSEDEVKKVKQVLVVFQKSDRKVIATFEINTIITEMNVLVIQGVSYLVTSKKDIFRTDATGQVYVKEI